MYDNTLSSNPLIVTMERLGINIGRGWRKERPLMCHAAATCALCPNFERCAADFEACRNTCLNATLFEHLPRAAAARHTTH